MIKGMEARGVDHVALLDLYVRTYNKLLFGRPAGMTVGLHICRGNFKNGIHFSEGGYDRIAIKLFTEINVDCYYLEYDTPRAGTFEPLRFLPKNKTVVLGLITSKFPQLEDVEDLEKRVHNAANIIANGEEKRSFEEALNQCVVGGVMAMRLCADCCSTGSASVRSAVSRRTRRGTSLTRRLCAQNSPWCRKPRRRSGVTHKPWRQAGGRNSTPVAA